MAETVGIKTEQKTSAGKEVYKTPEGESVSEKSVTIKFGDNAYVNAPSIHNGKRYTEDEIKEMLLEGTIKPTSRHDTLEEAIKAAKTRSDNLLKDGGMAKRMAEQMELFEPVERGFDEGGLMDEGGTVDPVSGNDVPPGSTQEEVRDDIPAQLSEGEFVFPADVVRYIGLENLMRMRQEAKQGLAQMDAMGQMGNNEEAIVEDDLPFDMYDLDVEDDDERNFNIGGYVAPTYTLPGTGIAGYQTSPVGQTGYTPYSGAAPYSQPVQFAGPQFQTATQTTNLPTFAETVGSNIGKYDELRIYINDAGQIQQIPFKDGNPIYPIPEGYRPQGDQPTAEQPTTPVTTTSITDQGDGGSDNDDSVSTGTGTAKVGSISDALGGLFGSKDDKPKTVGIGNIYDTAAKTNDYFGGSKAFGWSNEELRGATIKQAGAQFSSLGLAGALSSFMKEAGVSGFSLKDVGVNGFTAMNDSLNAMGLTNRGQLMNNAQASLVGKAMSAAHAATVKGQDVAAAYNKVMNTPEAIAVIDETLTDIKDYYARVNNNTKEITFAQAAEVARADARTFRNDVNDLANPVNGSARITTTNGVPINTVVDPTTGKRVQDPTKSRAFTEAGRLAVKAAEAKQKQAETNAKALRDKAERDKAKEEKAAQEQLATSKTAIEKQMQAAFDNNDGQSDNDGAGADVGTGGEEDTTGGAEAQGVGSDDAYEGG